MKTNLVYFLNALYYRSWKNWSESVIYWSKRVPRPFKMTYKKKKNMVLTIREIKDYRHGRIIGLYEQYFRDLWGFFILPYNFGLFVALQSIIPSTFLPYILAFICIIISYRPIEKYVFSHNRYVKYFKEFEKKDEAWHWKWKIIARLFTFITYLVFIAGVLGV